MEQMAGILLRIVITYLYLLAIIRLSGKRTIAEGTPFDLIVALIVGDMPDGIIWGELPLAQGLVGLGTIMAVHLLVVAFASRNVSFGQLVEASPDPLLRDGHPLRQQMSRQRVNDQELDAMLREQGVDDRNEVEEALLEPSGILTVQKREAYQPAEKRDRDTVISALS
jgi:uncharacterized membrane protein YcaP (DUF421 family)